MLLVVLLLGLLARGSVLWIYHETLTQDVDKYGEIATNLHHRQIYGLGQQEPSPTAFRPPLYPLLLAATMIQEEITPLQVALLHLILGLATIVLVYQLAKQYRLGRAAPLAALLVAVDPVLMFWSTSIMTETLATLLAVASLYCLSRLNPQRHWTAALGTGCLLGLSILCRPTFLLWLVLCLLVVAAQQPNWRQRLQRSGTLLAGALLMIAPWTIRNMVQFNRPIALTTHGGYTLLLGNNPVFYQHLKEQPWGTVWQEADIDRFKQGLQQMHPDGNPGDDYWSTSNSAEPPTETHPPSSEYDLDRFQYRVALSQMQKQPKMLLIASLVRLGRLWSPLRHQTEPDESSFEQLLRYLVASWYLLSYLLALIGLYRLRRSILQQPWLWGLLLVVALSGVHTLFWSNIRMRGPFIPWIALLAAAAWYRGERGELARGSTSPPAGDSKS